MKFTKTILKNGLRVVTVPMKDNPTVTVLVLVEAGSKYEAKSTNGVAHFLEHMCFKGTKKRPKAIDISRELDGIGSQYNAFTAQEYTGYYAKGDAKHFKKIFDVVSDIYLNSTFEEAEIQKEKGVIIEEINMYEDMPNRHVEDLIMKLLYKDQPAGWNIAGEKENILKMKKEDFVEYKEKFYVPSATTLVVSGAVSAKDVMKEVQKVFRDLPKKKKGTKLATVEIQSKPEVLVKFKETDQTHFVLAFRSIDMFSKLSPVFSVLSGVLGGGMSSRLFQKLREEMGVGYYVRAYNDAYTDHGFFQVSAGVDNKRVDEVINAVLEECKRLKNELVSNEELDKVKQYLVGNMKLSLESSDDIASFYGMQELLKKKILNQDEKAREINKVTASQIQKVAKELFTEEKLNLALIGPFKDDKKFLDLLKISG
jgi:predicted Zn-dependent peptidase